MIERYLGWSAFVLFGVACGSGSVSTSAGSDGGTDGGRSGDSSQGSGLDGMAVMASCAAEAMAECAKLESCSTLLMQTRYGSVDTCNTRLTATCLNALEAPSTGATPKAAEACSKAFESWACDDYLSNISPPSACIQKTGTRANGAACAFPAQCTTGFCALSPRSDCGVCAALPKAGDSCADLTSCGQGLVCFSTAKVCGTYGTSGASCGTDSPCGPHLSCIGADTKTGAKGECAASVSVVGTACDPKLETGPGCDYDGGLTCNTESKQCEPIVVSSGTGPCDFDNHQYAVCSASGTCTTSEAGVTGMCVPAAADGKVCSIATGGQTCLLPSRCIVSTDGGTSGICQVEAAPSCK
jgi:hypothetical protein